MFYVNGILDTDTYTVVDTSTKTEINMHKQDLLEFTKKNHIEGVSKNGNITFYKSVEDIIARYAMRCKMSNTPCLDLMHITSDSDISKYDKFIESSELIKIGDIIAVLPEELWSEVKTVTIPNFVTVIGVSAFERCKKLTTITIPSAVRVIDKNAFHSCSSLKTIKYAGVSQLEYIAKSAFCGCGIEVLTLPVSLKVISDTAFSHCESLRTLTIPIGSALERLGRSAFCDCTSLMGLDLSYVDSLRTISSYAFYNCCKLSGKVIIPRSVTSLGVGIFANCVSITSADILSDKLDSIPDELFKGCNQLYRFHCNSEIKTIGKQAFMSCDLSASFSLLRSESLVSISEEAFKYAILGKYIVVFGSNLKHISDEAFAYSSVKHVALPDSLESLGASVFKGCTDLISVTIPCAIDIPDYCFSGCSRLSGVAFNENTKVLGDSAFKDCVSLYSLILPNSVQKIGSDCFDYCECLECVVIPSGVTKISWSLFYGCENLKYVIQHKGTIFDVPPNIELSYEVIYLEGEYKGISSRLKFVLSKSDNKYMLYTALTGLKTEVDEEYLIRNASEIQGVTVRDGKISSLALYSSVEDFLARYKMRAKLCGLDHFDFKISKSTGIIATAWTSLTEDSLSVPDFVDSLDGDGFKNLSSTLKHITLSKSLRRIEPYTFGGCYMLESIEIPEGVTSIGNNAFFDCTNLRSVSLPDGLLDIDSSAFFLCRNLESVTIPDSVKTLGTEVFQGCSNLESVYLGSSIEEIPDSAFKYCSCLSDINSLSHIRRIQQEAFYDCASLKSICLSDSLLTIQDRAFACSGLLSVDVPASLQFFGKAVFRSSDLTTATVGVYDGEGLDYIPESAFSDCKCLTQVTLGDSIREIFDNAFSGCVDLVQVIGSQNTMLTDVDDYAFNGCAKLQDSALFKSLDHVGKGAFEGTNVSL